MLAWSNEWAVVTEARRWRRLGSTSLKLVVLVAAAVVVVSVVWSGQSVSEQSLLGGWNYVEGAGQFEVFALSLEGGHHVFRSWIHEHPDATGSWVLSGETLVIQLDHGPKVKWEVLSVSSSQLVVKEAGEAIKATYTRKPTRGFGEPDDK